MEVIWLQIHVSCLCGFLKSVCKSKHNHDNTSFQCKARKWAINSNTGENWGSICTVGRWKICNVKYDNTFLGWAIAVNEKTRTCAKFARSWPNWGGDAYLRVENVLTKDLCFSGLCESSLKHTVMRGKRRETEGKKGSKIYWWVLRSVTEHTEAQAYALTHAQCC